MKPIRIALVTALAAALAAAGSALGATHSGAAVKLGSTSLGRVVVNSAGWTLYVFGHDTAGKSTCYTGCSSTWAPLLTVGRPVAGAGIKASLLGTTKRRDGKLQVTYAGHPLYRFAGDSGSGQTNGEGYGNLWFAVSASGARVLKSGGAPHPTTTSGGYGYGSGY